METRSAKIDPFRAAFDDASTIARAIANHVVAGVPIPDDLVDDYARARGAVDRLLDEAARS